MSTTLNAFESLEIAEQVERNGIRFYRNAAALYKDPKIRRLFSELAGEHVVGVHGEDPGVRLGPGQLALPPKAETAHLLVQGRGQATEGRRRPPLVPPCLEQGFHDQAALVRRDPLLQTFPRCRLASDHQFLCHRCPPARLPTQGRDPLVGSLLEVQAVEQKQKAD